MIEFDEDPAEIGGKYRDMTGVLVTGPNGEKGVIFQNNVVKRVRSGDTAETPTKRKRTERFTETQELDMDLTDQATTQGTETQSMSPEAMTCAKLSTCNAT